MSHTFLLVILSPEVLCARYRTEDACLRQRWYEERERAAQHINTGVRCGVHSDAQNVRGSARDVL
jgi:hypothetical protein